MGQLLSFLTPSSQTKQSQP